MTADHHHKDRTVLSAVKVFAFEATKQSAKHGQGCNEGRASVSSITLVDVVEEPRHLLWQRVEPLQVLLSLGRSREVGLCDVVKHLPQFDGEILSSSRSDSRSNRLCHLFRREPPVW